MRLIGQHRGQNGRGAEGERGLLALSVLHGAWTERQLQQKSGVFTWLSVFSGRTKCTFAVCPRNPARTPEGVGIKRGLHHCGHSLGVQSECQLRKGQPQPSAHRQLPRPHPGSLP